MSQRVAATDKIFEDAIELIALQRPVRKRSANNGENLFNRYRSERRHSDDVLRENVVRFFENFDRVKHSSPDKVRGGRGFDEIVDVGRDEHAMAILVQGMPGTSDSLNSARYAFRRCNHDDEIDG